jgi:hypothetical protein
VDVDDHTDLEKIKTVIEGITQLYEDGKLNFIPMPTANPKGAFASIALKEDDMKHYYSSHQQIRSIFPNGGSFSSYFCSASVR